MIDVIVKGSFRRGNTEKGERMENHIACLIGIFTRVNVI